MLPLRAAGLVAGECDCSRRPHKGGFLEQQQRPVRQRGLAAPLRLPIALLARPEQPVDEAVPGLALEHVFVSEQQV